jgi:hypothetical protein
VFSERTKTTSEQKCSVLCEVLKEKAHNLLFFLALQNKSSSSDEMHPGAPGQHRQEDPKSCHPQYHKGNEDVANHDDVVIASFVRSNESD